jgi:hypothetical protein
MTLKSAKISSKISSTQGEGLLLFASRKAVWATML